MHADKQLFQRYLRINHHNMRGYDNVCHRERDDAVKAAALASAKSSKKIEDASKRHGKSSAAVKRLETDVAKLMNQVTALEHANRLVCS